MADVIMAFDSRCRDCRALLLLGTTARRVLDRLLCAECAPAIAEMEETL
jgi:hypothetical protein